MVLSVKKLSLLFVYMLMVFCTIAFSQEQSLAFQQNSNYSGIKNLVEGSDVVQQALPPNQAFEQSHLLTDEDQLLISWNISPGHYLYKNKIKIEHADVADIKMPLGIEHEDQFFGKQFIYKEGTVEIIADLNKPLTDMSDIKLSYQGCSKSGVCYPIIKKQIPLNNRLSLEKKVTQNLIETKAKTIEGEEEKSSFGNLNGNVILAILALLLAGIGLAFTPCVLPMLPILLGLINRNQNMTRAKTSMLSLAYALGIASMLAVFGVVVAKTGVNLQIIFQSPIWLSLFATIFFILGLSMLGVFKISMPGKIQSKVAQIQNKLKTDNFFSLYVAGALSILVIGPCVAPPLIGALAFISTTNNSVLGGVYLFSLGLGMGLPLTLFAIFSREIPKRTHLSHLVLKLFAVIMFAVGLWLLSRIVPGYINLILWGVLGIYSSIILWRSSLMGWWRKFLRVVAILIATISGSWLVGGLLGHSNLFNPFVKSADLPFIYVSKESELDKLLSDNEIVMFDLYADWCVACQEIEHFTLTNEAVRAELKDVSLVKLDVTSLDDDKQLVMNRFGLIGPPALLFFEQGKEIKSMRKIGFISSEELINRLRLLKKKK